MWGPDRIEDTCSACCRGGGSWAAAHPSAPAPAAAAAAGLGPAPAAPRAPGGQGSVCLGRPCAARALGSGGGLGRPRAPGGQGSGGGSGPRSRPSASRGGRARCRGRRLQWLLPGGRPVARRAGERRSQGSSTYCSRGGGVRRCMCCGLRGGSSKGGVEDDQGRRGGPPRVRHRHSGVSRGRGGGARRPPRACTPGIRGGARLGGDQGGSRRLGGDRGGGRSGPGTRARASRSSSCGDGLQGGHGPDLRPGGRGAPGRGCGGTSRAQRLLRGSRGR